MYRGQRSRNLGNAGLSVDGVMELQNGANITSIIVEYYSKFPCRGFQQTTRQLFEKVAFDQTFSTNFHNQSNITLSYEYL